MAAHFFLSIVDGLNASSVSEILLIPSKEDAVQRWLMQAKHSSLLIGRAG